ncbi:MAG: class I SAM-dependent methyltransferase [Flavobacteriales bacterium]|nr:class I SAM-dependent methyltransferase [Flavobacteriales bacterium]
MTVAEARALIQGAPVGKKAPQQWMDLGCGSGTFTRALAGLLPAGSTILAVDRDADVLRGLPSEHDGVRIEARVGAVERIALQPVDGVLMANVLHFIADQRAVVERLAQATPTVLLVEYDRHDPLPPWVPHPLPQDRAIGLFQQAGFKNYLLLGQRPSSYGPDPLYAMAFTRNN